MKLGESDENRKTAHWWPNLTVYERLYGCIPDCTHRPSKWQVELRCESAMTRVMTDSFPFRIKKPTASSRLVVLDKSFLDGINEATLKYLVQNGWVFAIPEVMMYEHLRKEDPRRTANMFKLHAIEKSIVILAGIGEMFRAEAQQLRPATQILCAKRMEFIVEMSPSGKYFELDERSSSSVRKRTADLRGEMGGLVGAWNDIRGMADVKEASSNDLPEVFGHLAEKVRADREDMRRFYRNHRHAEFPAPEIIDEQWSYFRWIQVMLLAGLDFIKSYGVNVQPGDETLTHEILDLTYLINSLLVGGVASRDATILRRFRFLLPDGVVLR